MEKNYTFDDRKIKIEANKLIKKERAFLIELSKI